MDTIRVTAEVDLLSWPTPDYASAVPGDLDGGEANETRLDLSVETAPQSVIDALAQRWLDNLYARRGEKSPFAHVRARD